MGGWCGREATRELNACPHCPGGESKQLDLGQQSLTCASAVWQQPRGQCSLVQKTCPEGAAPPDCWNPAWCQGPKVGPLQPPPGDRTPRALGGGTAGSKDPLRAEAGRPGGRLAGASSTTRPPLCSRSWSTGTGRHS